MDCRWDLSIGFSYTYDIPGHCDPDCFFSFLHMLLLLLLVSRIGYNHNKTRTKKMYKIWSTTPYTPLIVQGHHGRFVGRPSFYSPPSTLFVFFFHPREDEKMIFWKLHPADYFLAHSNLPWRILFLRPGRVGVTQSWYNRSILLWLLYGRSHWLAENLSAQHTHHAVCVCTLYTHKHTHTTHNGSRERESTRRKYTVRTLKLLISPCQQTQQTPPPTTKTLRHKCACNKIATLCKLPPSLPSLDIYIV